MNSKNNRYVSLNRNILYSMLLVLILSIVSISLAWYLIEINSLKKSVEELKQNEPNYQKNYLKAELERILEHIKFVREYYKDKETQAIQDIILEYISSERLMFGGYFFVNTLQGQALIYDGKRVKGYKNIADSVDPNGVRLFDLEKEAYYTPDGKFMDYLFKPLDSEAPEAKISYIRGIYDWEWIIGGGIYKNCRLSALRNTELNFYESFERKLLLIALISFTLIIISCLIVKRIETKMNSQIKQLENSFKNAIKNNNEVELNKIIIREFREIGKSVSLMLKRKRELEKKVNEKDQNLKSIFTAANNVAFIITEQKNNKAIITEFSPGAEKLFLYSKEEIKGKEIGILHAPGHFEDFSKIQDLLYNGLGGFNGEASMVKKGQQIISILYTMHPLTIEGKVTSIILVIINISERIKAERELKALKANLEQKIRERTREIILKNEELTKKNKELEHYNNLFVGREFRINELKIKIKNLEEALNKKK